MRASKPGHLHQAGSQREISVRKKWGVGPCVPSLQREQVCSCLGRSRGTACGMAGQCPFDGDGAYSSRTWMWGASQTESPFGHRCQQIATPSCAGGQPLWRPHSTRGPAQVTKVLGGQTASQPIPVAHRPVPRRLLTSDCQEKCATVWNFSCGWHKTHKQVTVPPGFIPGVCHLYGSCNQSASDLRSTKGAWVVLTECMSPVPCGFPDSIVVTFAPVWRHWRFKVFGTSVLIEDKVRVMARHWRAAGVCRGARQPKRRSCTQMMEEDWKHNGQNGQQFQWMDTDVWSVKRVPCWHGSAFSGTFIPMLFCFSLGRYLKKL